jgi:xylose isomerase
LRTYLILKDKAARWNADTEIQELVKAAGGLPGSATPARYSRTHRESLLAENFDRKELASKGLAYERLDQLTIEVLLGVR